MFMSSIVWLYSKDLLDYVALKTHFVVRKFQERKKKQLTEYMDTIVTAENIIYKLLFSITFVNNNPHIAIDSLFLLWMTLG